MPQFARIICFAGLLAATPAFAYTIDGNSADWGLHTNGNASDWNPGSGVASHTIEDQTGGAGTLLSPGYGGQPYDAEALYVDVDGGMLYLLLVTGLPKNNTPYAPGDFAIDFGRDGSFEYAVETIGDSGRTVGGVYSNVVWNLGLWNAAGTYDPLHPDPAHPTSIAQGILTGTGTLVYTTNPITNLGTYSNDLHYVIEAAVPVSAFAPAFLAQEFDVQWTMDCANDAISADPDLTIPEPGSCALLGIAAVAGWAGRRRVSS